jgi:hypothetical protein
MSREEFFLFEWTDRKNFKEIFAIPIKLLTFASFLKTV